MEPLLERAARDADEPVLWFWGEDGSREVVTLGALHRGMCSVAHALGARGLAPGDVVVLAAGHSRQVPAVFWGALYAGLVPTIFPYRTPAQSLERHGEAVRDLVVQSGARAVVTTDARAPELRPLLATRQPVGARSLRRRRRVETHRTTRATPRSRSCSTRVAPSARRRA